MEIPGISQWIDGNSVATIGRVKQTALAVEILGSWKVCRALEVNFPRTFANVQGSYC